MEEGEEEKNVLCSFSFLCNFCFHRHRHFPPNFLSLWNDATRALTFSPTDIWSTHSMSMKCLLMHCLSMNHLSIKRLLMKRILTKCILMKLLMKHLSMNRLLLKRLLMKSLSMKHRFLLDVSSTDITSTLNMNDVDEPNKMSSVFEMRLAWMFSSIDCLKAHLWSTPVPPTSKMNVDRSNERVSMKRWNYVTRFDVFIWEKKYPLVVFEYRKFDASN